MRTPSWFDGKVSLGNVVTWLTVFATAVYTFAFQQADVRALMEFKADTKIQLIRLNEQREQDRESLLRMEGDIRVIRQLVEQQVNGAKPR